MAPGSIPSCCLTSEQKDALIDAVRQRPVIWDCSLDAYQEVQNRRTAFVEVAELLSDEKSKYTGPEMQVEWKKLRDIFNRTLKKVVASGGSDAEVTWRYWTKLQFIADHERSHITRTRKWPKKEELSPPPVSSPSSSCSSSVARARKRMPKASPLGGTLDNSPLSLVQQLTEAAQSARELLKSEDNAKESAPPADESIGIKMENDNSSREENGGEEEDNFGEALGQIFMLSKQIAENGVGCAPAKSNGKSHQNAIGTEQQMAENDLPIRFLLNEWMLKGGPSITTNGEGTAEANAANNAIGIGADGNAFRHHPSPPAPKRTRWTEENGTATAASQQNGGGDQFDIFGMFIASQVRTLSLHSSQSALRLKRALTELCFQFEAQENGTRRRTTAHSGRN
ncbi:hypothetical protein niasHT_015444 [Heterodera trifolii]|uniref:MADF domain-containing protein n=1 Tax=Heterodera trifolii TaxID=157864 RepID=A0ABD2L0T7_9BILA